MIGGVTAPVMRRVAVAEEVPDPAVEAADPLNAGLAVKSTLLPLVGLKLPAFVGLTDQPGEPGAKLAPCGDMLAVNATASATSRLVLAGLTFSTATTEPVTLIVHTP